jgi:hypothetical protein
VSGTNASTVSATPDGYYEEVNLFQNGSACRNASCFTECVAGADRHPDYRYVPTDHYTVRGQAVTTPETAVVRLETPVGRERFFGTTRRDLGAVRPVLEGAPDWTRRDG